ncbi:growth arrest-specific protein 1-like [Oppia nitens]|uniref:growth arrest-specific protein 1-like n=1 Tax=Oppia nitens TaxID=1686743 RepID=UPI0023DBD629|nr:growth arrest-specific protein 1-like [Oppia nitens]
MSIKWINCTRCDIARTKCAYRMGCGFSLHGYMVDCADLIAGRTNKCQPACQRALIALMSTEEGQELVDCECDGSKFCELNKERIEVCRASVVAAIAEDSVVSCSTARWICLADPVCSTALDFYHRFCRGLFDGRRCTPRCNNSLSILDRQEKASKLKTCFCDGSEDFPCQRIKDNTERLCFGKYVYSVDDIDDNEIDVMGQRSLSTTVKPLTDKLSLLVVLLLLLAMTCMTFTDI